MNYPQLLTRLVGLNWPDQGYATCTAFLGLAPNDRLNTQDLCRTDMLDRAQFLQVLEITEAAGHAWVMQGQLLVLRPTPEYARMTRVGHEEPYRWQFEEHDLVDQVDDISLSSGPRLVAARLEPGWWSAAFRSLPSVPRDNRWRTPRFEAESLDDAIWGAVRVYRGNPLPQEA